MADHKWGQTPWGTDFTSVTIESGVTSIGRYAFYRYSNSQPLTYVTVSKMKTVSAVIEGLKTGKTCYVRVRTFKTVKGVTWYSAWSAVKSVTVK